MLGSLPPREQFSWWILCAEPVRLESSLSPLFRGPITRLVRQVEANFRKHESDQIYSHSCNCIWWWDILCWNAVECGHLYTAYRREYYRLHIQVLNYNLKQMDQLLPRLNSALCGPFASSIHSYCDYGDEQCCSPYPEDGNAAHHGYIWKYNQDVVDFIKHRLATVG